MENQQYCISARNRRTGVTAAITGPMEKENADAWKTSSFIKKHYVYFRVAKYPFKEHVKGGR